MAAFSLALPACSAGKPRQMACTRDAVPALRRFRVFCLLWLVALLAACAVGPGLVDHSFGFDAVADSPGIAVLDYRYGTSAAPGARMPQWIKRDVGFSASASTNGPMPVGDRLYVKWRLLSSGEVLEDTVDLAGRLPQDMERHTVYFVVRQRQLHVYLVSPDQRPSGYPVVGPEKFRGFKVSAIYPVRSSGH